MSDRSKGARRLIALSVILVFTAVTALLFILVGEPLVELVADPEAFKEWIGSYGILSYGIFAGIMVLQVIVAIIPAGPFQVAGGYAFGALNGALLSILGNTLGSLLVFIMVRAFGRRFAELFIPPDKLDKLRFIESSPKWKRLFMIIFIIPGSPKDILTYFAGLTGIKTAEWILIASLGRIPAIAVSALGGNAIGQKRPLAAALFFGGLLMMSALGIIIYRRISGKGKGGEDEKA
ncbi:MAG: TVP38/TMEM64 family protein [Lachnospiraceae bacterium]|nr:TVP38/TMEM64 family protein [Lachnospiraceae bacterium]